MIKGWKIWTAVSAALLVISGTASADPVGDATKGAKVFSKCKACHQVGAKAKDRTGPQLNDLFGRVAGSQDGYRYSKSMRTLGENGLVWTQETLDAFLANPKAVVPKTRMSYRGLKKPDQRADLLAYLQTFSNRVTQPDQPDQGAEVDLDPAILALEGDLEYGEYLSSECLTCHQSDGSATGIPSITQWPAQDFVMAMHAYKQKLRSNPVMQVTAGRLSNEEIAALAAYFEDLD